MKSPIVSVKWLNDNLNDENIIILDASLKNNISGAVSDFSELQIKNSVYFDIDNIFSDLSYNLPHMLAKPDKFEAEAQNLGINKNSKIIVYDNVGVYSSPRAYWMFKAMGHCEVYILNGGMPEWIKHKFPTEKKQSKKLGKGDFKSHFKPEYVRQIEQISKNIESGKEIVIDARSSGRFKGTEPEPRDWIESGSIENSKNIPFENVLTEGKYKEKSELINLFEEIGIDNKPVVFTCGSGLTACILLAAFEICGYQNATAVYDGSWTEWAQSAYFKK